MGQAAHDVTELLRAWTGGDGSALERLTSIVYAELHRQVDRLFLTRVLEYTRGNQHQAARLLGIARQTLRLKLRELGLQITRSVDADDQDFA